MSTETDYRSLIYNKHTSHSQNDSGKFDSVTAENWGRAYESYLKNWLPKQKDAAILEVGCGDGRLLHFLIKREYTNVTGIDINPDQISLAKQVSNKVTQANAIEFLKTANNKYDMIIGLDFIEHLHKGEVFDFLGACHNALKTDGSIILQTPNGQSPFVSGILYGDFTHEICFIPKSLQHILELCGFSNFHIRQTGPVVHGLKSAIRYILWQMIHFKLKLWNLIETGDSKDIKFTRTFLISAHKK